MGIKLDFKPLDLITVNSICEKYPDDSGSNRNLTFYVPAYQRGYRWNIEQVRQLIEDIREFGENYPPSNAQKAFYCLQPVVVKETVFNNVDCFEVIDGQQRLTTILLIMQAMTQIRLQEYSTEYIPIKSAYEIQYEQRIPSSEWLKEVVEAFKNPSDDFKDRNCDYYHFFIVYEEAYKLLNKMNEQELNTFHSVLKDFTRFIWYVPNDEDSGSNADIFDRLNAGKLSLNNAELIKALLLQRSNYMIDSENNKNERASDPLQRSIAINWDLMERRLQDHEFWGFIYSRQHPYSYDTHIEYLFDLLCGKKREHKEYKTFTFDKYLAEYRDVKRSATNDGKEKNEIQIEIKNWIENIWNDLTNLFNTLEEWFQDRPLYHRIGYILEFGKDSPSIVSLREELRPLKRQARIALLDAKIKDSLQGIRWKDLFHGEKELSKVLYLYNILLEDRRVNNNARFSFADYKDVEKAKGFDQEHVASNTDFEPKEAEKNELAADILELFTGQYIKRHGSGKNRIYEMGDFDIEQLMPDAIDDAKALCLEWQAVLTEDRSKLKDDEKKMKDESLQSLYDRTLKSFESDKDPIPDTFQTSSDGRQYSGKDFIWNFVLLNASTNRSYGNNIFPVKRRRILRDEYDVYTPVGTRNVFEKATSTKSGQMLTWTRTDALAYWNSIREVLHDYIILDTPFK